MREVSISVIIPVYNAEAYLGKCLQSLCAQTFADFEVWLIDDGSQDLSGSICDQLSSRDPRFHVLHKKNGGVSSARNAGLENAKGDWICFVDADDSVEPNYLQTLHQAAKQPDASLIIQGFQTIYPDNKTQMRTFENHSYTSKDLYVLFQEHHINRCGFPFGKLYSNPIIQRYRLRFDEQIHYAEDVMFMLNYMCHISSVQTITGASYQYYIRNNSSLSQRIFSFESEYRCYETYGKLMQTLSHRFQLPEAALIAVNNVISEYLVRRAIGALYQQATRKKKQERLSLLRSLSTEQIQFLQTYYRDCGWFHKVTVHLLSKHYYYLCDLLNQGIATGRALKQRFIIR